MPRLVRGDVVIPERFMPYLWAAYARGIFKGFSIFPAGLGPDAFAIIVTDLFRSEAGRGNKVDLLICRTPDGEIPVGVFFSAMDGEFIHPDVLWFPEASARNRMEGMARYILEYKDKNVLLWLVHDVRFLMHMSRYGLVRKVGTLKSKSGPRVLFQSVSKEV